MPCIGNSDVSAARHLAVERSQREHFPTLYNALRQDTTPTLPDEQLGVLGIARGLPLDVDDLSIPRSTDDSPRFFKPCDWTRASLEWESDSGWADTHWLDLTRWPARNWLPLKVACFRSDWFKGRLLSLESIEENVWEPPVRDEASLRWDCDREAINEAIGLELPRCEHPWERLDQREYPYRGSWAYFAAPAADKPHAVCTMLDASSPTEGTAVRSEVAAAVKLSEFQHQQACFSHHHTKPILVCTYFRNETARITQAHFELKRGRLVLRQSRVLDLKAAEAPPDAWLMLRWMASSPVGPTLYPPPVSPSEACREDKASRPSQISLPS